MILALEGFVLWITMIQRDLWE